jgi:outer membrane protein TolC
VAADRQVAAAFHSTESAKAAKLPRVTLSASLGTLIDPSESIWSSGADLLGPLFTGGRLEAEVEIATAQQKQAIAEYVSTAIDAFQEVESALASEQYLDRRLTELEQATARMARASRVGEDRYDAGMLSIVDLNVIRQQDFDSQSLLLQIQTDRLRERLRLYRALGGSFELPEST